MAARVNQTALHPTGVEYVALPEYPPPPLPANGNRAWTDHAAASRPRHEHTEIEEELHDRAHIDYDRVAIVRHIPHSHARMQ